MRTHSIYYFLTIGLVTISTLSCKSTNRNTASDLNDKPSTANNAANEIDCPYGVGMTESGKAQSCQCPESHPNYKPSTGKCVGKALADLSCEARPDPMFNDSNNILSLRVNASYEGKKLTRLVGNGLKQKKSKNFGSEFGFDMSNVTSVKILGNADTSIINIRGSGSVTMMTESTPGSKTLTISSVSIDPNMGVFLLSTPDRDYKLTSTKCDYSAHTKFISDLLGAAQK